MPTTGRTTGTRSRTRWTCRSGARSTGLSHLRRVRHHPLRARSTLDAMSGTNASHLSNVWFSVTPLEVASGHGCWVTTVDGEEYLDFAAGIAVNSTGHAHPRVAKAIGEQAQRFI